MKIKKSNIPSDTLINKCRPYNYRDSFECEFETDKPICPDDIQKAFWNQRPAWVETLFRLGNYIVKPFGLKTGKEGDFNMVGECSETDNNINGIPISDKSPNETVLCLDDKHLRAYLSVHIENLNSNRKMARVTTVVQFKNTLGYLYFYIICPFHYFVVKVGFKNAMKHLL